MHCRRLFAHATVLLVIALAPAALAADVLNQLPGDALGCVVVKRLAATDAKLDRLLNRIEIDFPGPLAFLRAVTGVSDGLDPQGDALFAVLPAADGQPQFALWLPVADYQRLITSLGGSPEQQIAGITLADEDVLIAHHERWALVMDPGQRERLQQLLAGKPGATALAALPPPDIASWTDWIDTHDVAALALPSGIRAALAWSASGPPARLPRSSDGHDNLFDFGQAGDSNDPLVGAPNTSRDSKTLAAPLQASIRRWVAASPQITHAVLRARLAGCAWRLDDSLNLCGSLRISGIDERWRNAGAAADAGGLPAALYKDGGFVLHGAGKLPPPVVSIAAGAYVARLLDELKSKERMVLPRATVAQFQQAVERASAGIHSAVILTQPGGQESGVYTNDFLLVGADPARAFTDNAKDVMRLWNTMNREAQAETRLIFDVEEVKIGHRTATQYSLDIAAADGAPELPEIRQAMELLFGPGGKLRLWIVPVDQRSVLLAAATPEQLAAALETIDRKQPVGWDSQPIADVNRLLPREADWRVFFSPHQHNAWRRREMNAITGPVIGGPIVNEFPPAPPVGLAAAVRDGELRIDTAIPAQTLLSARLYLKRPARPAASTNAP
jgi:hypothetical protein